MAGSSAAAPGPKTMRPAVENSKRILSRSTILNIEVTGAQYTIAEDPRMRTIIFLVALFAASAGLCQTPVKEADTIQSLLVEVRQLRQDIAAMTVASQRVQIALHALQMQDAAVARDRERRDNARNRCSGIEGNRQHTAADIQKLEGSLASGTLPENDARMIRERLTEIKSSFDAQTAELQSCQAAESEASGQFQSDTAKLSEVQDRIERLDKSLEKMNTAGK